MGYEAREDARSDYTSEIQLEFRDTDFDDHVADAVESGDFDTEVLERAIEIVRSLGVGDLGIIRSLKQILGEQNDISNSARI